MSSWMEERDRLVAQTQAFVAGIAAAQRVTQKPDAPEQEPSSPVAVVLGLASAPPDQTARVGAGSVDRSAQHMELPNMGLPSQDRVPAANRISIAKISDHRPSHAGTSVTASSQAGATPDPRPPNLASQPNAHPNAVTQLPPAPQLTRSIALIAGSERDDILKRVASFRERQSKLIEDRQKYYELMRLKIRKSLLDTPGDA